jgi:mannosyltransferase
MPETRSRAAAPSVGAILLVGAAVVAGIAFRLHSASDLWLDEALTVNIARLPIADLFEQLRHDGHPPLYYLLLHSWMQVFGEGDDAVRLLSAVFGVASLPLAWLAARRLGGRVAATAGLVLLATSPYAVRYSTEARMYALVIFLVLAGWLALRSALARPTGPRLAAVAVISGLLLLSHYWSIYLLASVVGVLGWTWWHRRGAALPAGIAIAAGGLLFVPWLPSFLEQAAHTGTPWGRPERPTQVFTISFTDWGGGPNGEAQVLGVLLLALAVLALLGRAVDGRRIELDLATRPPVRAETVVVVATVLLAVLAGYATASAFASRYTAVIFPLVVLVAAVGVTTFTDRRVRAGVLVAVALFGMVGAVRVARDQRTQGGSMAAYIAAHGVAGDVVAFCPDQLGPATMRRLPDRFVGMRFPDGGDPRLIDWVDYAERQESGDPQRFASLVLRRAGEHTVWLVWRPGYRTLGTSCQRTINHLRAARPAWQSVVAPEPVFEPSWLYRFPA